MKTMLKTALAWLAIQVIWGLRALLVLAVGCTAGSGSASVREMCGDPPARAEYTVAYARSGSSVIAAMPQADFAGLIVERDLARDWMACAAELETR